MIFWLITGFLICQRLVEVLVAKRNENKVKALGAIEFGARHYPYMVAMHAAFFYRLLVRFWLSSVNRPAIFSYSLLYY